MTLRVKHSSLKCTQKILFCGCPVLPNFCREQIVFPLQFVGKMGEVDVEAEVWDGGPSGQAGAIRFALSKALQSFVDRQMVEKMRLGKCKQYMTAVM